LATIVVVVVVVVVVAVVVVVVFGLSYSACSILVVIICPLLEQFHGILTTF